jgi:hypothetical protein
MSRRRRATKKKVLPKVSMPLEILEVIAPYVYSVNT